MIIKKDPDTIQSYLEDSSNLRGGYAECVVIPENIDELSLFLRKADADQMPVTISGGGTATTGSRIPFGGAVVSLEKFNKVISVSDVGMRAVLETGVLVEDLRKACEQKGLFYASHPTEILATMGGTVATNASGARSFKYGPTRKFVERLKMVLPNGEIWDLRRAERVLTRADNVVALPSGRSITVPIPTYHMPEVKRSAGYFARDGMDLIDLFVGQEGTLSVIVELELRLVKRPVKILSAFAFFKSEEDSWGFAAEMRALSKTDRRTHKTMIDALSIEYFSANALDLLRIKNPQVPKDASAAIFFEQEVLPGDEDALVHEWLDLIARHSASVEDTWVAMNEHDAEKFSSFRYAIPEAVNDIVRKDGFQKLSTDIAVPVDRFREMMLYYKSVLSAAALRNVIFGHIGECHVHVNVLPRSEEEAAIGRKLVLDFVRKGVSLGGTVSAEHGIGKIKHRYLEEMYGRAGILEMASIKKAFDPHCILGRNTMFPKEYLDMV